ncbi:MAG: site-2 protease family protein [Methanobacteriaceae archaeon]|nr:site-2 protease family protein [Methanobacteriaceae archaeon]MDP2837106.1 site-2 protease family protein [Methanobacteriaceae archaeon]MDP3484088.1 site-2 protease family protein [Methanobacteriaceae archaeon]
MVKFSSSEIRDILISMLVIAGVFAYILSERNINLAINLFPITLIAVGLGFVLHELAHKFVAIHYGFWAEYKLWAEGLVLAIITSFFGFVFAAPGAVYIHGEYISDEQNGKISLAGPLTNIFLALIFLGLLSISSASPILQTIGFIGFSINSFIALFNLIPFSALDGAKILRWNPIIWILTAAVAFIMTFNQYIHLF